MENSIEKDLLSRYQLSSCYYIYCSHADFDPQLSLKVGLDRQRQFVLRLEVEACEEERHYYIDYFCSPDEALSLAGDVGCSLDELPAAFAIGFTEESQPQEKDDLVWFFDTDNEEEPKDDPLDSFSFATGYDLRDEVKDYLVSRGVHLHRRRIQLRGENPELEPLDLDLPNPPQIWD